MLPYNGKCKITKLYGTPPPAGVTYKAGYHTGTDFVGIDNKNICSCFAGKVIASGNDVDGWGKYLKIQGKDLCAIYCHLSQKIVEVGDDVKEGELIGVEGATGQVTGSHLHLEFRKSHTDYLSTVDPCEILDIEKKLGDVMAYKRYNTIDEMPTWAQPLMRFLVKEGLLADSKTMDISEDMMRTLVVLARAYQRLK